MTRYLLPHLRILAVAALAVVSGTPATAQTSSLPGGATSLNETYKDWTVGCSQNGTTKRCALSQIQTQQNGQRVLAIELNAPAGNTVSGTLVMPFGLALNSGITFQIDDKPAMQPIGFRTCLPAGCLVNVTFDAQTLVALRTGAILKVKTTADGGAAAPFSISLRGFGTALDRCHADDDGSCARPDKSRLRLSGRPRPTFMALSPKATFLPLR